MSLKENEILVAERKGNTCSRWSITRPQHLAAFCAALFGLCAGAVDGWAAAAIPYLQQPDNFTVTGITLPDALWIVSVSHLGSSVGAIPAGYLANKLGRRRLMLFMAILMFLSWLMILSGHNSIPVLCTVRFIQGISCGVVTVAYYLYCDEIAEDRVRGRVGIYLELVVTVGMVYVYFCGFVISYVEMTILSTVLPVLFSLTFYWMPESPVYLLTKGQTDKANKSLRWLRGVGTGHSAEIEKELNEMESFINKPTDSKSFSSFTRRLFTTSETVQNMKIVFGPMVFRQLCGMTAVLAYSVYVFQAAGSAWDPFQCTVIFGAVQCVSTLITTFLVHLDRKRILPKISVAEMGVCVLVILIHSLLDQGVEIKYFEWLPLMAVYIYIFNFSVGIGPVPWFMKSDRLCKEDKDWVISIAVCLNSGLAFLVTKFFPNMMNEFGAETSYGTVAVICLVGNRMNSRWVEE